MNTTFENVTQGSECGVELGEEKTFLLDHQNYDANLDDGKHNVLVADPPKQLIRQHGADIIVGHDASRKLNPLLYRGVSYVLFRNYTFDTNL